MSITTTRQEELRRVLEPYAPEFEEAAREADTLGDADVFEGLTALARGEEIPSDVARRVLDRAGAR